MTKRVTIEQTPAVAAQTEQRNLYVRVDTHNAKSEQIGTRIVDMYHFGTRNWLQNHTWWAMHNGHTVSQNVAADGEVEQYVVEQANALAAKYGDGGSANATRENIAA